MPPSTASLEKDLSSDGKRTKQTKKKTLVKTAALQYLIQPSSVDTRMLERGKSKHKTQLAVTQSVKVSGHNLLKKVANKDRKNWLVISEGSLETSLRGGTVPTDAI